MASEGGRFRRARERGQALLEWVLVCVVAGALALWIASHWHGGFSWVSVDDALTSALPLWLLEGT